jgi:hypothetical protein
MITQQHERDLQTGRLLIELRRKLAQQNGVNKASPVGPDGLQAPKGWGEFVRQHIHMSTRRVQRLIALVAE